MVPDEVRNLGRVLRVDSEVFHFFFRRREKAICSWEFCKGRNFLKNFLFLTSIEIRQRHDLINGVGGGVVKIFYISIVTVLIPIAYEFHNFSI